MAKIKKVEMKKTIKCKGYGQGSGNIIEVYTRKEIEKKIENLNKEDIIRLAWKYFVPNCKTGYAVMQLQTGNLDGFGLGSNESLQACDSQYVVLYKFDQNFNIGDFNLKNYDENNNEIDFTNEEEEIEALFEYLMFNEEEILDFTNINYQLDNFYED